MTLIHIIHNASMRLSKVQRVRAATRSLLPHVSELQQRRNYLSGWSNPQDGTRGANNNEEQGANEANPDNLSQMLDAILGISKINSENMAKGLDEVFAALDCHAASNTSPEGLSVEVIQSLKESAVFCHEISQTSADAINSSLREMKVSIDLEKAGLERDGKGVKCVDGPASGLVGEKDTKNPTVGANPDILVGRTANGQFVDNYPSTFSSWGCLH